MTAARPARRPLTQLVAAALACLAAILGAAAGPESARADAPQVTIVTPGGAQHTLALEALAGAEDVVGRTYTVRSSETEATQTVTGFSIAALLETAGIDPFGFSYIEVQRPAGGAVQLSEHQALEPSAFADGPPVVYAGATGTGFLRPAAGPEDDNAGDSFEAPQGLTIDLRKGSSLQVRVEAMPRRTVPGKKVHFRAVVERSGSGEALTWSWYFDDGHSGDGESAVHAFAKPDNYAVVVGVKATGESTGTSAVVRIQVGEAPAGGPDRQGGGKNKAASAPDHGAAAGPVDGASSPSSAAAAEPAPAVTAAPTDPSTAAKPPTESKPKSKDEPKSVKNERHDEETPPPPGEIVSGELLAGESVPEAAARRAAARTGSPQGDGDGGGGIPTAAWGLGAIVALLGAGGLLEAGAFTDLIPRIAGRLR